MRLQAREVDELLGHCFTDAYRESRSKFVWAGFWCLEGGGGGVVLEDLEGVGCEEGLRWGGGGVGGDVMEG